MGRASNRTDAAQTASFDVLGRRRGRGQSCDRLFAAAALGGVPEAHAWLHASPDASKADVALIAQHLADARFEHDYTNAGLAFNYMAEQKLRDLSDSRALLYGDERSAAVHRTSLRAKVSSQRSNPS